MVDPAASDLLAASVPPVAVPAVRAALALAIALPSQVEAVQPVKLVASAIPAVVPVNPSPQVHVRVFIPPPREQVACGSLLQPSVSKVQPSVSVQPVKLVASAIPAVVPVDPTPQVHVRVLIPSPRVQVA